jgi:hypothetical protein
MSDSADFASQRASAVIRRQRVLLIITGIALLACVAGLVASRFVRSPAQRAAEQAPPAPSLITAAVVSQVLTQQVTVRGSVDVAGSLTLLCRVEASPAILTRVLVGDGDPLAEGQQVAEVSGRPVFVMTGAVPTYRGLALNDKGTDVTQLQASLRSLKLLGNATAGTFDKATAAAVVALFKAAGYPDPGGVPLGSVVFVPSLPATVGTVSAHVGDEVGGQALMTVLTGEPVVDAVIPPGQQSGIAAGQAVSIGDEANQRTGSGTIASIGAFAAQQIDANGIPVNGSMPGYPVKVSVSDGVDASWIGASVAVTITVVSTPQPVLAVPVTAVQTATDGHTFVTVSAGGTTHEVPVTAGMVAAGLVEVTPSDAGGLAAGDQVVVG